MRPLRLRPLRRKRRVRRPAREAGSRVQRHRRNRARRHRRSLPPDRRSSIARQADPAARAALALPKNANVCAPYLGSSSAALLAQGNDYLARYDATLKAACDGVNAHTGTGGGITCTYNALWLADSDFTIGDLSTVDYFHPSLAGQARMAEDAWQADVWAATQSR